MSTKKEMLAWHDLPPSLSYSVWRSNNVSPAAICAQHLAIILRTRFGFNHLISNKREYNNCFFRKKNTPKITVTPIIFVDHVLITDISWWLCQRKLLNCIIQWSIFLVIQIVLWRLIMNLIVAVISSIIKSIGRRSLSWRGPSNITVHY